MSVSPTLTGTPFLPTGAIAVTQTAGDNSTAVATTAYVDNENLTNANLTGPITSVGNATSVTNGAITNDKLAGDIDLTSKVTGILPVTNGGTGVSSSTGTGNTVLSESPTFTGTPTLPTGTIAVTQDPLDDSTKLATTKYVDTANTLTDEDTDATNFLTFANDATGSQPLKTNANITVDAATATITANAFSSTTNTAAAFSMVNDGYFTAKNSGGTDETFLTPRNASNETLFNYGAGGFNIRNNGDASTIYMLNSGNIGIGNTTPLGPLSFTNSVGNKIILHSNGDNVSNHYGFGIDGGLLQMYSPGDIVFGTGASGPNFVEKVRIKSNGNVGIGNNVPQHKLQIGSAHTDQQPVSLRSYEPSTSTSQGWSGAAAFGGSLNTVIIGEQNGRANIGGHNPTLGAWADLTINSGGGAIFLGTFATSDPIDTQLYLRGSIANKAGGGTWGNTSDERIKKDIASFTNALDKISRLEGKKYKWVNPKEHNNHTEEQFGFIAQEVEKVFPNWVQEIKGTGADGELTAGKTKNLSFTFEYQAYVVEAIKELKTLGEARTEEIKKLKVIDTIKTEVIDELKAQLEILKKELDILKNKN
jgi:hypothetical protein